MKKEALISIIIPVYNVEKYLEKCIYSIVHQTYTNVEIILVDDGSEDQSAEICDAWGKKDPRIKVIHKVNGGLSDARNAGLKIAEGEYIGFVDGDDYIERDMYETLIKNMNDKGADLSICNCERVDENGKKILNSSSQIGNQVLTSQEALQKLYEENGWCYVTVWNKLYSRKSLSGIEFPKGKIHEDEFVIHEIFYNCERIVCTNEKKYYYVQHMNSIMSNRNGVKHLDAVEALINRFHFFQKHNLKSYNLETLEFLKTVYCKYRNESTKIILNKEPRDRIKEIDKIFRKTYFGNIKEIKVKDKLKYRFPSLFFGMIKIKNKIAIRYRCRQILNLIRYIHIGRKNQVILLDTPVHGNLGDQAIVLAENQFLKDREIEAYELTAEEINYQEKKYAALTSKNKVVLIPGGGFLGSLWPIEEERFRRILQAFKHQKIVVFPQTVTFDMETENGRAYLKESQAIYSSHSDLTIFVREKKSFEFMEKYFPKVNCKLVPDIVTMLQTDVKIDDRQGILLCLRKDIERNINESDIERIVQSLKKKFPEEKIEYTDTVVDRMIFPSEREREVNDKLQQFAKSKLIITDRLHGMIFAAITGTPCIALSNSNGKVQNVYEWIRNNSYIRFVKSVSDIEKILNEINLTRQYFYNQDDVKESFSPLEELLLK